MLDHPADWLTLDSGTLRACIDPVGAQLSVLQDASGRDLLWNGDASIWAGRAPLLFPIVGALANGTYRLGSAYYPLPRHGFARGRHFELVETDARHAVLRLRADVDLLEVYPFAFELDVHFDLNDAALSITSTVRNLGSVLLPASFGFHPAFRWPLPYGRPRASHYIEFETNETAPIRRLNGAGLLTATLHPTPVKAQRLELDDRLFYDDVIIFDDLDSRAVSYGAADGPRIRIGFPDAQYLGVWTKPGAPFICIEPWRGVADPQGYAGEFTHKPGVINLEPSDEFCTTLDITLLPA